MTDAIMACAAATGGWAAAGTAAAGAVVATADAAGPAAAGQDSPAGTVEPDPAPAAGAPDAKAVYRGGPVEFNRVVPASGYPRG